MIPKETDQTIRQKMVTVLSEKAYGCRDLSKILRIPMRDVPEHLSHIARSLSPQKKKLITLPYSCLICGFGFRNRTRFTRPSRCPQCRGTHIEEPKFRVT